MSGFFRLYEALPRLRPNSVSSYLFAFLAVAIASAIRFALREQLAGIPYASFFLAVTLVALFCGAIEAYLAVALSGLVALYVFLAPPFSIEITHIHDLDALIVFGVVAAFIATVGGAARVASEHYREYGRALRSMFSANPDAMLVTDPAGIIVQLNDRAETIGLPVAALIPTRFRDRLAALLERCSAGTSTRSTPMGAELIGLRADGTEFPADVQISSIRMGGRSFLMAVVRDMTQSRAATEELAAVRGRAAVLTAQAAVAEELSAARDLLATTMQALPQGVVAVDREGVVTTWNAAAARILGVPAEEAIGCDPEELRGMLSLAVPPGLVEMWSSQKPSGSRRDSEFVARDLQGRRVVLDITETPIHDAGGAWCGYVYLFDDVTERKEVERERRRWADAFENASVGITVSNPKTNTTHFVNPAFASMHGLTVDEAKGRGVEGNYVPDERPRLPALLDGCDRGMPVSFESVHLRKDGSRFPVRVDARTVSDPDGRVLYRIATVVDITGLRQAEAELRASEAQLRIMIDDAPIGIAMFDCEMRYLATSRRFLEDYGFDGADIVGRSAYDLVPDFPEEWRKVHRECLAGATHRRDGVEFRRADGKTEWMRVLLQPWRDARGGIGGLIMFSELITQRKLMEQQLQQSQKMEAVGTLTGGLAHDFNNILGVVIGNLDLTLPRVAGNEAATELVGEALDAATRGADLTNRLLAFARRQPLKPVRLETNQLVAGVAKMLRRLLGEDVTIALELGPDLWPVTADPAQLESALANLATNARDAMPKGGKLTISTANRRIDDGYLAAHPEAAVGDYVQIAVTDTGTGMSPEAMTKAFEPFFTTKPAGKGTGLGLSMVFGFIKQSGGYVAVDSAQDRGTTITLHLPRTDAVSEARPIARLSHAVPSGSGETVLVVEDSAALRRVVARQLGELGYRVVEAEHAAAAEEVLARESVDLLFSDIIMPGMLNGFELARRAVARDPGLKVLLTSGYPGAGAGPDAPAWTGRLLTKPYRKPQLAQMIREIMDAPA